MSHNVNLDAFEKTSDITSLQKQIADLLKKNKSLEKENEKLSKRFGLVWPEQLEFFVQVISDTEVVYQNGLYHRVGTLETNGSKARLDFDGSDESEELKRGDSPYLYSGKQSNNTYLGNGGIAYEWRKFINEDYLPTLVKKGSYFGFDDKKGQRNNLLIEGDNYHALQVLQHTHRGAVDVIYIDPPYNTGNGDFKYNDRFVSDEDGNKHSSWLSFLEKRLALACTLLSPSGFIAISIDDKEQAHLKVLCDQVFGEKNRVNDVTVKMSELSGVKMSSVDKKYPKLKETVLIYAKNISLLEMTIHKVQKKDGLQRYLKYYSTVIVNPERPVSEWVLKPVKQYLSEMSIKTPVDEWKIKNADRVVYRTSNKLLAKDYESNGLYLSEVTSPTGIKYINWEGKEMLFLERYMEEYIGDIWGDISTINLAKESCGAPVFNQGQKPLSLLKRIIKSAPKSSVVLDFFAGSGSTGHAVWDLNHADGGDRTFVLVTNNESSICEEVTYERLHRCNLPEHGDYQQGLEYLQLQHVAETKVDGYDMATSFEYIKQVVNVRFGSFSVIEETDDWYITDKIAVLKNYVKYPAFFEKYGKHAAYGLVTKKERQAQTFRTEASKRVSIDDIHVFNKEYLNDLYRVVREDMA